MPRAAAVTAAAVVVGGLSWAAPAAASVALDQPGLLSRVTVCLVLLLLSAMVSGAEAALNELEEWRLRRLGDGEAEPHGAVALFERDPGRFMQTLLIARTIINASIASLATLTALQAASAAVPAWRAALYGAAAASLAILVVGQLVPRALAIPNAVRVSRLVIRPVYVLSIVLYPIGALFTWLTTRLLRLFRLERDGTAQMSEDELRQVLRDAEESGVIEAQERQMIRGVIDLEETVVREVMTPRVDVIAIARNASLRELVDLVTEEGYSRVPVYDETIDNVVGMVYARDLIRHLDTVGAADGATVADLVTTVQFVPETLSVLNLLRDMRVRKSHFAVVVDEFGGTSGVVTLEDIIEEITGEIYDETDEDEEADIVALPDGGYRLLGSAHLESIGMALDIVFDEDGDYDTLAGFMIDELGHIPEVGEVVTHGGLRFEVEQADGRRVVAVVATPLATQQPAAGADTDYTHAAELPASTSERRRDAEAAPDGA